MNQADPTDQQPKVTVPQAGPKMQSQEEQTTNKRHEWECGRFWPGLGFLPTQRSSLRPLGRTKILAENLHKEPRPLALARSISSAVPGRAWSRRGAAK